MYESIRVVKSSSTKLAHTVAVMLLDRQKKLPVGYETLDAKLGGAISGAIARTEFSAARGAVTTVYPAKGAARVFIVGLGDGNRLSEAVRIAAGKLLAAAHNARIDHLDIHLGPALKDHAGFNADAVGSAVGEGLTLANFEFLTFKGTAKDQGKSGDNASNGNGGNGSKPKVKTLTAAVEPVLFDAASRGSIVAQSQNLTRTLAATPPNVANPTYLAAFCKKMAKDAGLSCTVIDAKQAKKLGMGGLCAVGQAGSTPPCMIVLEWKGLEKGQGPRAKGQGKGEGKGLGPRAKGQGAEKTEHSLGSAASSLGPRPSALGPSSGPLLLVGKAITFDTGGYSLKPSDSQTTMKYDKCGGAAVIGAMHAIASLKLQQRVVAVIAAAENMVDQNAYRVQDIITFHNGVTCEVTNTDAEGRLVLADALSYGCAKYKPRAVVDLATLTGGVVIALGSLCAGAFVNDTALREHLFDAAEHTDERLWHLPMWDEYKELMKGHHADLINSSPVREAHPIQGAVFLSYFVAKDGDFKKKAIVPWAHLDIAGVSDRKSDGPLYQRGPTGYGVRLLVRAVETWK